jgi:hypothetical protein
MTITATHYMKNRDRYYPCQCGYDHPSVTTILDVIGSPALLSWAAKNGTHKLIEYAKVIEEMAPEIHKEAKKKFDNAFWKSGRQQASDAADYGTQAHAAFEMHLLGKEVDTRALPEPSRNAYEAFVEFERENKMETLETEKTFYNCSMGYAGTADWSGKLNGKLTLGDFKTSSGIFEKYVTQCWANAIADEMSGGERLYEQVAVFRFGKDGSHDILIVPRKGLTERGLGSYEQARDLIQGCLVWFQYKKQWELNFPWKKEK